MVSLFKTSAVAAFVPLSKICMLQEWEPYEADMAVPMTSSDLSLKVRLCMGGLAFPLLCAVLSSCAF